MKADLEGDFWKDIFVHLQHKNMVRTDVQRLTLSNAQEFFDSFARNFPDIKTEITNASSYITWETFITSSVKLRLFIQNQIKASLLKVEGGDLVKIADAKFPYNPFPEIQELVTNKDYYENALNQLYVEQLHNNMQLKIAREFAAAIVEKRLASKKDAIWNIELAENGLLLKIKTGSQEKEYTLSVTGLLTELEEIFK